MSYQQPWAPQPPPAPRRRRFYRHPLFIAAVVVVLIGVGFGSYWFQPWKLFTNTTVDEAIPTAVATAPGSPGSPGSPDSPGDTTASTEPVVVAEGSLITHEHDTSGTVKLLRLPDDSLVVRVENLDTSDGPQLVVLMSDAPVVEGTAGWHVFEDGRNVDLGPLKGNKGSSNYPVPAGTDIKGLDSVSIWCDRFNVSFGAATLTPV